MYDRTGLSTKCTLIKTGFKNARTGTKAKFRPFVDALVKTFLFSSTVPIGYSDLGYSGRAAYSDLNPNGT